MLEENKLRQHRNTLLGLVESGAKLLGWDLAKNVNRSSVVLPISWFDAKDNIIVEKKLLVHISIDCVVVWRDWECGRESIVLACVWKQILAEAFSRNSAAELKSDDRYLKLNDARALPRPSDSNDISILLLISRVDPPQLQSEFDENSSFLVGELWLYIVRLSLIGSEKPCSVLSATCVALDEALLPSLRSQLHAVVQPKDALNGNAAWLFYVSWLGKEDAAVADKDMCQAVTVRTSLFDARTLLVDRQDRDRDRLSFSRSYLNTGAHMHLLQDPIHRLITALSRLSSCGYAGAEHCR